VSGQVGAGSVRCALAGIRESMQVVTDSWVARSLRQHCSECDVCCTTTRKDYSCRADVYSGFPPGRLDASTRDMHKEELATPPPQHAAISPLPAFSARRLLHWRYFCSFAFIK
jgi:hypothetical protein